MNLEKFRKLTRKERKLKEERHKGSKLWFAALNNMPGKRLVRKEKEYIPLTEANLSVPEYIEARAKGMIVKFDFSEHGLVECLIKITKISSIWNQEAVLRVMMGDILNPPNHKFSQVRKGFAYGVLPKDPKRLKRLKKLATPAGRKLAWKYLKEVGKDHLYMNPEEQNAEVSKDRP